MGNEKPKLKRLEDKDDNVPNYFYFSPTPAPNFKIHIGNDMMWVGYREKPFTRFHRWAMWFVFGWKVENL